MSNFIYAEKHFNFLDRIVENRREKFFDFMKSKINFDQCNSYLDIGTTQDKRHKSSNYLNKKFDFIKIHKSISDQKISNKRFSNVLQKSITSSFSSKEILDFKSDFVISNATIEHVGSLKNQFKMVKNMIKLTNKVMIIQTINRFFPIDTHTKLPLLHMLPKPMHRKIIKFLDYDYYSLEEHLNMLSINDMENILKKFRQFIKYKIYKIRTLGFVSNILVICYKN
jgi:hypothetical protein